MRRWLIVGGGAVAAIVGFLLFRPDTLFTEVVADESLEEAFAATTVTVAPTTSEPGDPTTAPSTSTTVATGTKASPAAEPVAVGTGRFRGIDHEAAGTATVYEQDGSYVLRFEDDTEIQNGPDLYVWLLAEPDYEGGTPEEYLDLGLLKGTVGGQNYPLPAEFDPELHQTVLIWCLRFAVPFAAAPLS